MWLLRERLSDFSETSSIELITLYLHPKNSNHLRSHSRAVLQWLLITGDGLGLENKSVRIFCFRQVYFTKSCQGPSTQNYFRILSKPLVLKFKLSTEFFLQLKRTFLVHHVHKKLLGFLNALNRTHVSVNSKYIQVI